MDFWHGSSYKQLAALTVIGSNEEEYALIMR